MKIDTIIAEIKSDYPRYMEMGAFDYKSLYTTSFHGLKRFGNLVAIYTEDVIEVINGQAILPQNYWEIALAIKVNPKWYKILDEEKEPIPQAEIGYIETTHHGFKWNSCNECCVDECKTAIKHTLYLHQRKVEYHYQEPEVLTIGKNVKKDPCYDEYRNRYGLNNRGEVNINGNILYADFDGLIYLWYKGIPVDKDRKPYIPNDPNGSLYQFMRYLLEASVLKRVKHKFPKERAELMDDLNYAIQQSAYWEGRARTDLKMNGLSPESYDRLAEDMRSDFRVYDDMLPKFPNHETKFILR